MCVRALVFQRPSSFGGRVGEGGLRGLSRFAGLMFKGLMVGSIFSFWILEPFELIEYPED